MKLAAIFSDGMILQRDKEVYVFGESDTSEAIKSSVVDEDFLRKRKSFAGTDARMEIFPKCQASVIFLYLDIYVDCGIIIEEFCIRILNLDYRYIYH